MTTYYETTLNEDMTFGTITRSASGAMTNSGTYRLVNENTIEFTNLKKWPDKQTLVGPLVGEPIGPLDTRSARWTVVHDINIADKDTSYFRFVDENTLLIGSPIPGIAPVTFRRAGPVSLSAEQAFQIPIPGASFRGFGNERSIPPDRIMLYIFVAFIVIAPLLALCSLPR